MNQKRLFNTVLFLVLTTTVAFSQTEDGLKLIEREQPTKGMAALRKAVATDPSPINYFNLGSALVAADSIDKALPIFEKGIAVNPKDQLNLIGKGRVLLRQNKLQDATVIFDNATKATKSKNVDVLNAIAEAWLDKREFMAKAKPILEKSEGIKQSYKASILLGDMYLAQGNGGLAITNYEHAAMIDAKNGFPHYKVGVVYVRSTNKDAAIESFKKAVEVEPGFAPAYKELAELYYITKKGEEAAAAQQKYMQLAEGGDAGLVRQAFYLFMARDFAGAKQAFEKAYQKGMLKKGSGFRYYFLTLVQLEDFAGAQKIFQEYETVAKESATTTNPVKIDAADYVTYGNALIKQKPPVDTDPKGARNLDSLAVLALEQSLKIDSTQIPIRQQIGEILYTSKRYVDAAVSFEKLTDMRSKGPTAQDLYWLTRAYYNSAFYPEGEAAAKKLMEAQPLMSIGYLWGGRNAASQDPETDKGLGKPYYEKLIELSGTNPDKVKPAELKESYSYLGYWYYLKNDPAKSKANWEKVLSIDPNDVAAKEAIKAINQAMANKR